MFLIKKILGIPDGIKAAKPKTAENLLSHLPQLQSRIAPSLNKRPTLRQTAPRPQEHRNLHNHQENNI